MLATHVSHGPPFPPSPTTPRLVESHNRAHQSPRYAPSYVGMKGQRPASLSHGSYGHRTQSRPHHTIASEGRCAYRRSQRYSCTRPVVGNALLLSHLSVGGSNRPSYCSTATHQVHNPSRVPDMPLLSSCHLQLRCPDYATIAPQ
jgi:hypothetical protein